MGILSMFQNPMPDVAPEDYQSSNQSFLNSLPDLSSIKNINLKDYIPDVSMPRVFGSAPAGYEGLLGADRTKSLESSANLQGLLGMASALAQGMSSQGPRRSALQNVLSSLAGGFGGASQAYERGLTQYGQQQQIAQSQIANQQAAALRSSVEDVMKMPEVANNPALIAALRAEPAKTLAWINENMGISQAYAPAATAVSTQPNQAPIQEQPTVNANGEKIMAPAEVIVQVNPLLQQKDRLMMANQKLTGLPGERAQKAIDSNLKQIENIDKQIKTEFDIQQKQRDYTNEARRVAASMFPNAPLEELNQGQLTQLQSKLDQIELAKRKAGASNISIGDKTLQAERAKGQSAAEEAAMASGNVAADVRAIVDILKPYRGGGLQDFAAKLGNYLPGTSAEQLATAQNTANSIAARVAPTLRVPGSGATSDYESKQFLSAIPSLMNTASGRELMATYMQRFADRAAAAADIRAQMVDEGTYSMRGFQKKLKDQGFAQILTPDDILILQGKKQPSNFANPNTPSLLDRYAPKGK